MEIITITEISDEQSTITNWGRHLIGIRFGNYLDYYMTLVYFLIMMTALLIIGGDQIVTTMELLGINLSSWNMYGVIYVMTSIMMLIIYITNAFTIAPGQIF